MKQSVLPVKRGRPSGGKLAKEELRNAKAATDMAASNFKEAEVLQDQAALLLFMPGADATLAQEYLDLRRAEELRKLRRRIAERDASEAHKGMREGERCTKTPLRLVAPHRIGYLWRQLFHVTSTKSLSPLRTLLHSTSEAHYISAVRMEKVVTMDLIPNSTHKNRRLLRIGVYLLTKMIPNAMKVCRGVANHG